MRLLRMLLCCVFPLFIQLNQANALIQGFDFGDWVDSNADKALQLTAGDVYKITQTALAYQFQQQSQKNQQMIRLYGNFGLFSQNTDYTSCHHGFDGASKNPNDRWCAFTKALSAYPYAHVVLTIDAGQLKLFTNQNGQQALFKFMLALQNSLPQGLNSVDDIVLLQEPGISPESYDHISKRIQIFVDSMNTFYQENPALTRVPFSVDIDVGDQSKLTYLLKLRKGAIYGLIGSVMNGDQSQNQDYIQALLQSFKAIYTYDLAHQLKAVVWLNIYPFYYSGVLDDSAVINARNLATTFSDSITTFKSYLLGHDVLTQSQLLQLRWGIGETGWAHSSKTAWEDKNGKLLGYAKRYFGALSPVLSDYLPQQTYALLWFEIGDETGKTGRDSVYWQNGKAFAVDDGQLHMGVVGQNGIPLYGSISGVDHDPCDLWGCYQV
ncbi:hypothetical protein [Cysteiniphilum sp. QT6929]|uniref:hypothetical protein n=1 Tax=Cysteiniphilum sp. QT6929 TaxID=2975055 RepID=UPI0024B3B9FB|nr:hypothetical protein [Cysteiniphilum sp. QT6929]WHN65186.1 hypothetical protein NYP54_09065 [Cysteiniphilum sp. QT6929]